jgi:hypothetical protein
MGRLHYKLVSPTIGPLIREFQTKAEARKIMRDDWWLRAFDEYGKVLWDERDEDTSHVWLERSLAVKNAEIARLRVQRDARLGELFQCRRDRQADIERTLEACAERDALGARVEEQDAKIERLTRERDEAILERDVMREAALARERGNV